jgi:signal transduction histidine kinase/ligand-binding sensor domain-containing protein
MSPMLRNVCLLLFLWSFVLTHKGYSQLPVISFEVITSREGLPSNTVLSATCDKTGFIWFGTRQCPVRYDGVTFKSFTSYTTNFITGIAADKENNIWFSSDRTGVSKITSSTLQMTPLHNTDTMTVKSTGHFFLDSRGKGWYSDHLGVNQLDLETLEKKHYRLKRTTYVGLKAAFAEDRDKNIWIIGKDNGIFRYDRQRDTLICVFGPDSPEPHHLEQLYASQAIADKDGFLWIGTYNLGLIKYDPHKNEFETFPTGRIANQVVSLAEGVDENGKRILWIGDERGLGIFRPDQKKFYFFSDLLPKAFEVNYIFRNPDDGIVWICTSNGVIKYHPLSNVIQGITFPASLDTDKQSVNVVHQDQRKNFEHIFYFGLSNNVLLRWDRSANELQSIKYPGDAAETKWIRQQKDETLWIGTNRWDYERPGIFVYDLNKERFITPKSISYANQFFSVPFFMYGVFDERQKLWVGNSDEGVHVVDRNTGLEISPWNKDTMKDLVKNNNLINDIIVDRKGKLWLGTYRGVYFFDDSSKQFVTADPKQLPKSMDDAAVNSLLEDRSGNIWAARWGSLTKMKDVGTIETVIATQDGFADRQIQRLAEDYNGNIWIGNYEGLYCFNPTSKRLTRFTMNDGLLNNSSIKCISISNDGKELFVGHINGFNLVKVDAVLKAVKPPPLVFNNFKVHEQEKQIDFTNPLQLKPTEKAFSVDFVALNYRKQDDNQYAYYLEGFEQDWNYSGSKHTAYYTNLHPGAYTLHVKAGDAFGNWNEQELTMDIEVLPAFYQTWWFKVLLSLVIAGILYAIYQYRINQLLHLQQVRNRISADLHDELGSTLSGISIMGSLAKREPSSQELPSTLMDRIMEDVRQMSSSLDDIVWNISPKNDALSSLIARMTRYASELFEAKQINFKLKVPERISDIKLSMDQRRNVYLIFKESVNNLVKYSKCKHAAVSIDADRRNAYLTIEDDGIGFDQYAPTDRNGIRNLKERARTLKGKLDIESSPGKGTIIRLEFPVNG